MIFSFVSVEGPAQSIIGGIILFLFGLLCLTRPDILADLITIMSGVFIIASGAVTLNEGIYAVRSKIGGGVAVIILSIIFMICGFYVMFAPFAFIMVVSGAVMICDGIFNLIFAIFMGKRINDARQA